MKKRKKRVPTLPAHITPIMPDYEKSIDSFNHMNDVQVGGDTSASGSLSEDMRKFDIEALQSQIIDTTIRAIINLTGEEQDDVLAYTNFDIEDEGDRIKVEVRTDLLDYDNLFLLCQKLDPIVAKYDPDSYFEMVTYGIIDAYLYKPNSLGESLKRVDRQYMQKYGESYDLYYLYEAAKLSDREKKKLAEFVKDNDDPDEIQTYITGLINKKNESLKLKETLENDLRMAETPDVEAEFKAYVSDTDGNIYDVLPEDVKEYLDLYDGPWVAYSELPSGTCYYTDDSDILFFKDINQFIDDVRYSIEQGVE